MNTTASPPYPLKHSGPCIVAGSAWCLHEDLSKARDLFGDCPILAVNGASREVKSLMLVSQHPENFINARWRHHQKRLFGGGFTTHSTKKIVGVDYVWDFPHRGGSAWLARRIAGIIGFSPVVLVGCPLTPGNYANHRPGFLMSKESIVNELLGQIAKDIDWHKDCYSMSGATKELLGEP